MASQTSVVVIGQGSIGIRHAEVAAGLGCRVVSVSRRVGQGRFTSIKSALETHAGVAVVATETARHSDDLAELAALGFQGEVLVEKPVVADVAQLNCARPPGPIYAGYNVRFMHVVKALRAALAQDELPIVAAQLHVGQAFDTWRPGRDPALVYSAFRDRGGGALRDLSHELDLALWMFGPVLRVAAVGGRYTNQTVDSDDAWSILLACERCPQVTLTLNGIDRQPRRSVAVTTAAQSYSADLVDGVLRVGDVESRFPAERNQSYRLMWTALLNAEQNCKELCSWDQGAAVVKLIDAIETANASHRWVDMAALAS